MSDGSETKSAGQPITLAKARQINDLLCQHWEKGTKIARLPRDCEPIDEQQAYAVQQLWETHSAYPLYGWKIAATSPAGQAHIGVGGPLAGRLLRETVLDSGATCLLGSGLMRVAELEFAFKMGETLPPRDTIYRQDEVLAAVATLHPAIEIPDTRLEEFDSVGAMQLIADNACAWQFMLGDAAPSHWRSIDLAAHAIVGVVNAVSLHNGVGANALRDPRRALTWLTNRLSALGVPLRKDQVVTTGVCTVPIPVSSGDRLQGDFGSLGELSMGFA